MPTDEGQVTIRPWAWLTVAIVPMVLGVANIVFQRASDVVLFDDEMGFLGQAVGFSTRDGDALLRGIPFYSTAYPALLAGPLSLVPGEPWRIAVATNVVLLGATGLALLALAREVIRQLVRAEVVAHPPETIWLVAAAVTGAASPVLLLQTPRAWSEVLAAWVFASWAAALAVHVRRGLDWTTVPLAVLASLGFWVHRRFSVVVVLTLGLLAIEAVRTVRRSRSDPALSRRPAAWAAAGVVSGLAVFAVAFRIDSYAIDRFYLGVTSGSRVSRLDNLRGTGWIPTLLGHVWSLTSTSFGLAAVGVIVLGVLLWRRIDPAFAATLALAIGGIVMTSVTFLGAGERTDHMVYERYSAPIVPVLATIVVIVAATGTLGIRRWVVGGPLVIGLTGGILLLSSGEARLTGNFQKFTVPALTSLNLLENGWGETFTRRIDVSTVTILGVAGAITVAVGLAKRGPLLLTPLALLVALGAVGASGNVRPFADQWESSGVEVADALRARGVTTIQYVEPLRHESRNIIHYRLGYLPLVEVDEVDCDTGIVLAAPTEGNRPEFITIATIQQFPGAAFEIVCTP